MAKYVQTLKYKYKYKDKDVTAEMDIDLSRFERQYSKAQKILDSAVMSSMLPFMPMDTSQFIDVTKTMSASIVGSGKVIAAAPPFGRYLYFGKTMVDEKTGSPWARKGAKKILVSQYKGKTAAKANLEFSKNAHPRAQAHWFDAAKEKDGGKWVRKVKKDAGGGEWKK